MTPQKPPVKDQTPPPPHWKRALEDEDEQPGERARFRLPRLAPAFIGGTVALAGVLYGLRASGTQPRPVQVAQAPQPAVQTVYVPVYQSPGPQTVQPVRTAARPPPEPRPRANPCLTVEGWRICRP